MTGAKSGNWMGDGWPGLAGAAGVVRSGGGVLWLAVLIAICAGGVVRAQQNVPSNGGVGASRTARNTQPEIDPTLNAPMGSSIYQERRLRQLNVAQHKAMVSDTDKLLKMVTELNAEISGSNPDSLTPDQIRKVAEIEKLAHSVKDKMRIAAQGAQDFLNDQPALPNPAPSRR
jgi:hypothetical protein